MYLKRKQKLRRGGKLSKKRTLSSSSQSDYSFSILFKKPLCADSKMRISVEVWICDRNRFENVF